MKNNKGFATTFILFGLLILFLIIMGVLMATLSNSSTLTSNLRNKLTDNVESPNIYKEYNFAATGDVQIFTAPVSKMYIIEGWSTSGKYLKISKQLKKNEQLYLYIGTSTYNGGNTDIRTVYGTVDDAASRASIFFDVNANGAVGKSKPSAAGANGYVKIKYSSLQAKNIGYNNGNTHIGCSNVQCALDIIPKVMSDDNFLCIRATEEQLQGYPGQVGTAGELHSGDAFVCDVNGDYAYDPSSEMFHYVSDYFDTSTQTFEDSYAALIYSDKMGNYFGPGHFHDYAPVAGPDKAKTLLPTNSQWKNVRLYKETRAILGEYRTTHNATSHQAGSNGNVELPSNFSYAGYSARLLTAQELMKACGLTQVGNYDDDELNNCRFLAAKTVSPGQTAIGYWLETFASSPDGYYDYVVQGSYATYNSYGFINIKLYNNSYHVRPVIDVKKTDIDY